MTPEEYLRSHDLICGMLYYPGCGNDYVPLKLFVETRAVVKFFYVDYLVHENQAVEFLNMIPAWKPSSFIKKLTLESLRAKTWEDFWPENGQSKRFANPSHAYAFHTRLFGYGGINAQYLFFATEAVQTYAQLLPVGLIPTAIVLQDHGFGCNWTKFGGNSELYRLAKELNALPELLLVADNTCSWEGYEQVSDYVWQEGSMHNNHRALFRKIK